MTDDRLLIATRKPEDVDAARTDLKVTACYCSILGECWTSHLGAYAPRLVAQCSANGHVNFRESPGAVAR